MNSDKAFRFNERPNSADPYNRRNLYEAERQIRPLLPDEQELWNNCMSSGFFKAGVPVGLLSVFFKTYVSKKANKPLPSPLKQTLHFGLNCFLGTLLYSPICFGQLQKRVLENDRKIKQMKSDGLVPSVDSENILENNAYSETHLEPKLDEPQSNFSHLNMDFVSSMDTNRFEEETKLEDKPKIPETTYDELRRRNRYNYKQELLSIYDFDRPKLNSSNLPEKEPEKLVPPKPKNKYGDEME